MYICVSTLKKLKAGEILLLEKEHEFNEIAVKDALGDIVGFALHSQPEGCVDFNFTLKNIGEKRILVSVVLSSGDASVLFSESTRVLPSVRTAVGASAFTA